MDMHKEVTECRARFTAFTRSLDALSERILCEETFSFFQEGTTVPVQGPAARQAIVEHLRNFRWSGLEILDTPLDRPDIFAAMACCQKTLEQIRAVNEKKQAFRQFHHRVRKGILDQPGKVSRDATDVFRRIILKAIDEELLNLAAVDRQIPQSEYPLSRIVWHYNTTAASSRKTMADAKATLAAWMETVGDARFELLNQELASIEHLPNDLPVAYCPRQPVTALKFRATGHDQTNELVRYADYGRNPVFFPSGSGDPEIKLPPEITGEKKIQGRGRKKSISDRNVTPSLEKWFYYLDKD
ncbi:hypothetical protein HBA55_03530 [Pseudomaricurvus alkylphenolicus]|uniref:hypothetical protein n=1 Tax=Pseudomaricurvus alkylphenolicus TaxID=1306991 RepID=UPI00142392D7|nr:hypothetical protein [Pseudomaricurvus alkylphenolicus]NIB38640.1 hypothetical protein [Pseudomaricurvus alkylphenolicus]